MTVSYKNSAVYTVPCVPCNEHCARSIVTFISRQRGQEMLAGRSFCTYEHYFTLLYTSLHYFTLLYTTLHYFTLLYTTIHYSTLLYYVSLLYNTLQYFTILYNTFHFFTSCKLHHTPQYMFISEYNCAKKKNGGKLRNPHFYNIYRVVGIFFGQKNPLACLRVQNWPR